MVFLSYLEHKTATSNKNKQSKDFKHSLTYQSKHPFKTLNLMNYKANQWFDTLIFIQTLHHHHLWSNDQ